MGAEEGRSSAQKGAESTARVGNRGVEAQSRRQNLETRRSEGARTTGIVGDMAGLKLRAKAQPVFSPCLFPLPWFLCHSLRDPASVSADERWLGTVETVSSLRVPLTQLGHGPLAIVDRVRTLLSRVPTRDRWLGTRWKSRPGAWEAADPNISGTQTGGRL